MTEGETEHSPLGASSMERWANCPGSVALLKHLKFGPDDDEPDYRKEGTSAHALAALCLTSDSDPWEHIGETIEGMPVTRSMALSVQRYVDWCREGDPQLSGVEFRVHSDRHPLYLGTCDRWELHDDTLRVRDYKNGAGVVVEVEDNPQLLYYAWGVLQLPDLQDVKQVELGVCQPNAFHPDGPIRTWMVSADFVREWADTTLFPLMARTAIDTTLTPGEWCRFCPAKLVCPMLRGLFGAAAQVNPSAVLALDDQSLARDYALISAVKMYIKAVEAEVSGRLFRGASIETAKLVPARADRVWKDNAETIFAAKFGEAAYSEPKLLSPAQMEKLPEASELVREWSFKPTGSPTLAPISDKRPAVVIKPASETFQEALATLDKGE